MRQVQWSRLGGGGRITVTRPTMPKNLCRIEPRNTETRQIRSPGDGHQFITPIPISHADPRHNSDFRLA